jgi:nucleotide-binding universal stress UspA family protein
VKLLVLTPEPIDAAALRSAAGDDATDAEVLVISPAAPESGLRFWMSDVDDAIEEAQETAEEAAQQLAEDGVDAVGDTAEPEPAVAIQDALATFSADRVVVFAHADDRPDLSEIEVPVTFAEI